MKTIQYTAAITMALFLGTVTAQAQSTRRVAAPQKEERVAATRQSEKEAAGKVASQQRNTSEARQVQRTQVQRAEPQRTQVQRAEPQRQQPQRSQVGRTQTESRQTAQRANTESQQRMQAPRQVQSEREVRQPEATAVQRPASITTGNNPRSTYRKPDSRVIVTPPRDAGTRVNKYSSRRYYGGNHYHYVYPKNKARLHYHYDTYVNHYHVLYYPTYSNVYWTRSMYRDYRNWYPNYHWSYRYGYRIQTISVFDARYNLGEVAMVYGRVYATWHNTETDDYLLFFGGNYPYQEFTVVLPGNIARRFSWRPERYFLGEHITVTGLITTFDGIPEIIVKNKRQVGIY